MVLTPGRYIPDAPPPSSGGDGTIEVDPAALEKLKSALRQAAGELESNRFEDVQLDEAAFGASPSGAELGAEHRTAHAIIADTIRGVVTDLWGYRQGVEQFETGLSAADDTAAEDLRAREAGIEALTTSATSNNGEAHYRTSQANHLAPGARDAGTDQPGDGPAGESGQG